MKKLIYCDGCEIMKDGCCNCSKIPEVTEITICDTCGEKLYKFADSTPVNIKTIFSDYDFCGLKCASEYINAELKKESK